MRKIKFRAWHKTPKGGYMHTDLLIDGDGELMEGTFDGVMPVVGAFKDDVLMQYTGLKDKNDKEIYEGDLTMYGEVAYLDDGFCLIDKGDNVLGLRDMVYNEKLEVLGNIYENPELIK